MSTDANGPAKDEDSTIWNRLQSIAWARTLRLWSGCILMVFLTLHLINHAAGVFGIPALDTVQTLRWKIQMNWLALSLIYGSFFIHIVLGLWRVASRKTLRLQFDEWVQVVSSILIPLLLIPHLIHTRVKATWFEGSGFYESVLTSHWPEKAWIQIALVIIAWFHGVVGLHMAFRHRRWYELARKPGYVIALLLPALAIAGFISAGREVAVKLTSLPESMQAMIDLENLATMSYIGVGILFFAVAALMQLQFIRRKLGARVVITYRGRGPVRVPLGTSVLDASRIHAISHPSLCRGKGRCSTCRVQVLSELSELPEADGVEKATLTRFGAPANVRLACQLRPERDITVRIVLPVLGRSTDAETSAEAERWAVERTVTVLALSLRAFDTMVELNQPYELAALVNRFSQEIQQAVSNHSGTVVAFFGDGLVAVFDEGDDLRAGAQKALGAARDMTRMLKILNKEMGGALPIPIRAGIGIHSDLATLARIGETEKDSFQMAFGAAVDVASMLQLATKDLLSDCLVSETTARLARIDTTRLGRREIEVERKGSAIVAFAVNDWRKTRSARSGSHDTADVEVSTT